MDFSTYKLEHEVQQEHWWFVGRRALFRKIIKNLKLRNDASIIDVGCSSGTNLRMLKEMGFKNYAGLDFSEEAKLYSEKSNLGKVIVSDIEKENLEKNSYDLVLATDILEHLKNDQDVLKKLYDSLKPNGYLLLTVPCFKSLWGPQDIISHHLRRYNKSELEKNIKNKGYSIKESFHFNFLLFVPIFLMRKILLASKKIINENTINNKVINSILKLIFHLDCLLAPSIKVPFGVSCLILAQKTS